MPVNFVTLFRGITGMAKRQPNFSGEEVDVLVGEVEKKEKILFRSFGPGLSSSVKDGAWDEV